MLAVVYQFFYPAVGLLSADQPLQDDFCSNILLQMSLEVSPAFFQGNAARDMLIDAGLEDLFG